MTDFDHQFLALKQGMFLRFFTQGKNRMAGPIFDNFSAIIDVLRTCFWLFFG